MNKYQRQQRIVDLNRKIESIKSRGREIKGCVFLNKSSIKTIKQMVKAMRKHLEILKRDSDKP